MDLFLLVCIESIAKDVECGSESERVCECGSECE